MKYKNILLLLTICGTSIVSMEKEIKIETSNTQNTTGAIPMIFTVKMCQKMLQGTSFARLSKYQRDKVEDYFLDLDQEPPSFLITECIARFEQRKLRTRPRSIAPSFQYVCHRCKKTFRSSGALKIHRIRKHSE